jgi:flagellar protein FlgJ
MNTSASTIALDARSLDALRASAHAAPDKALLTAAKQFEAVFMQMVLKSMRSTVPDGGLLGGNESKMYTDMFDTQLSQTLAKRGMGVGDLLARQLAAAQSRGRAGATGASESVPDAGGGMSLPASAGGAAASAPTTQPAALASGGALQSRLEVSAASTDVVASAVSPAVQAVEAASSPGLSPVDSGTGSTSAPTRLGPAQAFVDQMMPYADAASRSSGIPAQYMIGQAALESGWGRRQIVAADGTPSNNLFGIKAGAGWSGRTVDIMTTEYVNGAPRKMVQRFRAYDSFADSFADYAALVSGSARYAAVPRNGASAAGFAQGLQRAGYATDPGYADKLTRVINQTLSMSRAQGGGRSA